MPIPVETPIREEFDSSRGRFSNYDAYDATLRTSVLDQKHVDIRSFVQEDMIVGKPIWILDAEDMDALNVQTMGELDADQVYKTGEQWTSGTVARQTDRNNWRGITLACTTGTNTTASVIRPPTNPGVTATTAIEKVDLLTDFTDSARISVALPAFPLSSINTASSYIDFTSNPDGDFAVGPTASVPFSDSEVALVNGDSELRFSRSKLDLGDARPDNFDQSSPPVPENFTGVELDRITGVRFRIQATASCTFRAMALRMLDPSWNYTQVDMDTRLGILRPTVSRTGNTATAYDWNFPNVFRAQEPPSKDDPRPIDATVEAIFDTGSLAASFTSSTRNSFTVMFREASLDAVAQQDLNGLPMEELNGKPQPEASVQRWEGKEQSDLDVLTMAELTGSQQIDLEREPDTTLANWQEFTISWTTSGFASIKDAEGNGYDFGPFNIEPRTRYLAIFELCSYTGRIQVFKLDAQNRVQGTAVFDSNLVIDDFVLKRKRGRIGWKTNFLDGDIELHSLRVRDLNYAEYRSAPFESLTPVEGAILVVAGSEPINLLSGWESGPFGGQLRIDNEKSSTSNAIRVEPNEDDAAAQGLWTNWLDFTNLDSTEIAFDIWYPSSAKDAPLQAFLFNEQGASIPVSLGRISYDAWDRVKITPGKLANMVLGRYRFALIQPKANNLTWWIDRASVIERKLDWYARADQSDAFHDERVDWVPFRHLTSIAGAGVMFDRGTKLQVKGLARRQDSQIGKIQVIPKYAQLGRFVWEEDELVGILPPYAQFSYVTTGKTVFVNGFESYDPQGEIISYEWAFGDGEHGWGGTQTHVYPSTGQSYTIALTVSNKYGVKTTTSKVVTT